MVHAGHLMLLSWQATCAAWPGPWQEVHCITEGLHQPCSAAASGARLHVSYKCLRDGWRTSTLCQHAAGWLPSSRRARWADVIRRRCSRHRFTHPGCMLLPLVSLLQ